MTAVPVRPTARGLARVCVTLVALASLVNAQEPDHARGTPAATRAAPGLPDPTMLDVPPSGPRDRSWAGAPSALPFRLDVVEQIAVPTGAPVGLAPGSPAGAPAAPKPGASLAPVAPASPHTAAPPRPGGVPAPDLPSANGESSTAASTGVRVSGEGLAPGSTSTPLRLAAVEDPRVLGPVLVDLGVARLAAAARASDSGDSASAASLRDSARVVLERARVYLSGIREPRLGDLFQLARCEEKLGRTAIALDLFAEIVRRDVVIGADGRSQDGPWGSAARVARSVIAWDADTSGWRPVRDVQAIDWR